MTAARNPYVLGMPIKNPADFYGREIEIRELFESIQNMQPVALVGEHRCGNTSLLFQVQNPEMQARFFDPSQLEGLLFAFADSQLAADGPDAFFRRIARSLKRADSESSMDFDEDIDQFWIEDYLEDLADRDKRLVLLMDEFEVLSGFAISFWEWFRGLITEYDMSIVVATRVELGEFRDEWGTGSPFFNMFRSIYLKPFSAAEIDAFLSGTAEVSGVELTGVREAIVSLSGGFPYYLQVASALFYDAIKAGTDVDEALIASVAGDFRSRTESHFEDIWGKLPDVEREGLAYMALHADTEDESEKVSVGAGANSPTSQAGRSLERRGYLVAGKIFSTAFADYIRRRLPRIELRSETGEVWIERRAAELPPKEFALLRFFLEKEGEVVSKDEIAEAVWPEYDLGSEYGVTDAMIQKTISRLRKEVDVDSERSDYQHIESIRGQGYRFQNAKVSQVYTANKEG